MSNKPYQITNVILDHNINENILPSEGEQINLYTNYQESTIVNVKLPPGDFIGERKVLHWVDQYGTNPVPDNTSLYIRTEGFMDDNRTGITDRTFTAVRAGGYAFLIWAGDRWLITAHSSNLNSDNNNPFFTGVSY